MNRRVGLGLALALAALAGLFVAWDHFSGAGIKTQEPAPPPALPRASNRAPIAYAPPTLQSMRDQLKKQLDELEAMSPEEWNRRHSIGGDAPPPGMASTLEFNREAVRQRYEAFEKMTEEQWQAKFPKQPAR